jgi:hypothetical protein
LLTSGQGTIQFVLRNGVDQQKAEINPTRLDQLASSAKPAVVTPTTPITPRKARPTAPPPKLPPVIVVEVIQGNQRSVQKF